MNTEHFFHEDNIHVRGHFLETTIYFKDGLRYVTIHDDGHLLKSWNCDSKVSINKFVKEFKDLIEPTEDYKTKQLNKQFQQNIHIPREYRQPNI